MDSTRSWQVLLLGGASGVGKTRVSYRLARHYDAALTEVDDFQIVLERMTSPEQYPALHAWRLQPEWVLAMTDDELLEHTQRIGAVMAVALAPVIANHVAEQTPIVLEGDFIFPALAVSSGPRVRAVFLYEPDEAQIRRNYLAREGEAHPRRPRASWRYSEWLRAECALLGIPTVAARPWDTVLHRVVAAIEAS
ncbi:MAG: hypothetical protein ACRD1H_17945 [Vicinamibacterales bacterium]